MEERKGRIIRKIRGALTDEAGEPAGEVNEGQEDGDEQQEAHYPLPPEHLTEHRLQEPAAGAGRSGFAGARAAGSGVAAEGERGEYHQGARALWASG